MTLTRSEPRRLAARLCAVGLLAAGALAGVMLQAPAAYALSCTPISDFPAPPPLAPLPGSCFEGYDGDQVDPDGLTPAAPAAPNRLDWGSAEVLAGAQKALDFESGGSDSQFGPGGQEQVPDSWTFAFGSQGADKYDFISGYSYQEQNTADLMFAMGFVRRTNNGTSWLAFELNQKQPGYRTAPQTGSPTPTTIKVPTRSSGDLLITYSVANNNSPKPVIGLCKWVGDEHSGTWTDMAGVPVGQNCPALGPALAQADMNGADIATADNFLGSPAGMLEKGTFGEAAINLSEALKAAGGNPNTDDPCVSFGYFWAHSRSSESITSNQQDYILPADAISVANCAVAGTKWHDKNGNGLIDGGPDGDAGKGGYTIYADYDNDGVKDPGEPFDVSAPRDANDNRPAGTYLISGLIKGTYPIREVGQTGWVCTSPVPVDTDPSTDPLSAAYCGHTVTMTGSLIGGRDFLNFQLDPKIDLEKSAVLDDGANDTLEAGDEVDYTFEITNTGNVTLTGVDLDDALVNFADAVCGTATLAPGAKTTCTASHQITQADLDAGTVDNAASACGTPPTGADVCDPDTTSTPLPAAPRIDLVKSGTLDTGINGTLEAGDEVDYSFTITNTGNVTLTGVDLTDAMVGYVDATCNGVTTLAPGASTTCQASHALTQAEIDAGSLTNDAEACGDPPAGAEVCDPAGTTTPLPAVPAIDLVKTGSLDDGANDTLEPGDEIDYEFTITNTGNVTLSGVDLDDALVGFADATCGGVTSLAPGATTTCQASYVITQADIDTGTKTNNADACGDAPQGGEVCDPATTTTPLDPDKRIDLVKTGALNTGANGMLEAGDTIDYGFTITNTGNVTLSGVDLTDALVGFADASCDGVTTLAPAASTDCQASYTLTQADIDAGTKTNNAQACGDPPVGTEVCDQDSTTTPLPATPGISLEKTASLAPSDPVEAGDTITYTFLITNTGNVTLSGVDLTDALVGFADAACDGVTTLAPGASTDCQAIYTLTQADIDAGKRDNDATACGDAPGNGGEVCASDDTTTPLPAAPRIDLEKTAVLAASTPVAPGDTITYTFAITNTGNVTLDGVDLDDALVGLADATCGGDTQLAPGEKTTCTQDYDVTQADIDAGQVDNAADACGDSPADIEVCDPDTTSTPLPADPEIGLVKQAVLDTGGNGTLEAGDEIDYAFTITNTGNVTLSGVDLDDALVGFADAVCGGVTTLAPGASTDCQTSYVLTQADIDAGAKTNHADACGDAPDDGGEVCDPDTTITPLPARPAISLGKTAVLNAPVAPQAGDTVTYTFLITNTGNVTLSGVDLDDDKLAGFANVVCGGAATLAPGATTTCTGDYALTQADVDSGSVTNLADACGDPPGNAAEVCDDDTTTTPLDPQPGIELEKTAALASSNPVKAGDKITYTFEISNSGNVTLTGTDLDDALVGFDNALCGKATLAPAEKTTCTADHTLTQADIDAGKVDNLADACADAPQSEAEICDEDGTSTPLPPAAGIDLEKTGVLDTVANPKAGDTITYTFELTNTGNVTLRGVDLDDALVGFADAQCGVTELAPGAKTSCTAVYTITQDDIDRGSVANTATACADPPVGPEVCDPDTTTTTLTPATGIQVEKDGPATAYHGSEVTYTFLVSNTGSTTLTGVGVTDDRCAPVTGPVAFVTGDADDRLEVGEQWRFTCTTTVPAHADGEANPIVNTVTAVGTDPQGAVLSDTDTHSTLVLHPAVNIAKSGPASAEAGQRVTYLLTVTNPGDVPLTGQTLSVTDPSCDAPPQLSGRFRGEGSDPTPDTLDPGDRWLYICSVPTTAGQTQVLNTAFVTGEDPNRVKVSDEDAVTTQLVQPQIVVLPETVVSGAARLAGPSRCVSKAFTARVRGKRIKRVVWSIDGKRRKTFTSKTGEATRASLRVNPRRFGEGVHRLSARITFDSASRTRARTLRMTFQKCARRIIAPKFTG